MLAGDSLMYMNSSGLEEASWKGAQKGTAVNLLDACSIQWLR